MERQLLTWRYNKSLLKYYTAIFTVAIKVLKEDLYVYMNDLTSWIVMKKKGKKKNFNLLTIYELDERSVIRQEVQGRPSSKFLSPTKQKKK